MGSRNWAGARRGSLARLNSALKARDHIEILSAMYEEARRQGVNQVAKRAGMTRSTIHAALSPSGNPTLATSLKVSEAMGIDYMAAWRDKSTDG